MKTIALIMLLAWPSSAFSPIYGDYVEKEAKSLKKGDYVRLVTLGGDVVIGKWAGYIAYDGTIFLKTKTHWLAEGYDIVHIVSIKRTILIDGEI